jgi:hypothetical protein
MPDELASPDVSLALPLAGRVQRCSVAFHEPFAARAE